jgi:hypothetical protein
MAARTSLPTLGGLALALGLAGCAASSEAVGTTGGADTENPYVKLRFAQGQADETAVPGSGQPTGTTENLYATGIIEVANVAYDKEVVVHYQGPNGWVDSNATYYGPSTTSGNELWSFTTGNYPFLPQYSGEAIYFAIEYTVGGTTVWDNNGGSNYVVGVQGGDGTAESPVALGEDNLKVSDFSLVPAASGYTFTGHVVLKNLAYQKQVYLVSSTDDWSTTRYVTVAYNGGLPSDLESWQWATNVGGNFTSIQFAAYYEVDGATYWDNNLGANYTLTAP